MRIPKTYQRISDAFTIKGLHGKIVLHGQKTHIPVREMASDVRGTFWGDSGCIFALLIPDSAVRRGG